MRCGPGLKGDQKNQLFFEKISRFITIDEEIFIP